MSCHIDVFGPIEEVRMKSTQNFAHVRLRTGHEHNITFFIARGQELTASIETFTKVVEELKTIAKEDEADEEDHPPTRH